MVLSTPSSMFPGDLILLTIQFKDIRVWKICYGVMGNMENAK